jgi:hypothetical protein
VDPAAGRVLLVGLGLLIGAITDQAVKILALSERRGGDDDHEDSLTGELVGGEPHSRTAVQATTSIRPALTSCRRGRTSVTPIEAVKLISTPRVATVSGWPTSLVIP